MAFQDKTLIIDCQTAGIAGDMIVGALIDLGADAEKAKVAMELAGKYLKGCHQIDVTIRDVRRRGFKAKRVEVKVEEELEERTASEVKGAVKKCVEKLGLHPWSKGLALNTINTLIGAEAKVHGTSPHDIHLHEVGSADTVADIVGAAFCLEDLGLYENVRVYSTPVSVGGGTIKFSHGIVSSPPPAVVEILRAKGFALVGGPISAGLCTPTGASILVNMADASIEHYPAIKPMAVGYGAGEKDFTDIPNVLRITLGEALPGFLSDEVFVLETNVDDVTGEVIGHAMEKLMEEGARDVSIIPIYTKENRPGQIIQVITDREKVDILTKAMMRETGTLGVRIIPCRRHIMRRGFTDLMIRLEGKRSIRVKVAKDEGGKIIRVKPEYQEARKLTKELNLPLRRVLAMAEEEALKQMKW